MRTVPYDPERAAHRAGLWACKRRFETGLGESGGDGKAAAYEAKLTDDYRREWLAWVERCVSENPRCVTVAERDETAAGEAAGSTDKSVGDGDSVDDDSVESSDSVDDDSVESSDSVDDDSVEGDDSVDTGEDETDDGADEHGADGDRVAGYVFVLPESLAYVWDAAVLNEIYVRPVHRGTGLADELLESGLAVARDQSLPLDRMVLDVDRDNDRARAFYERHGFDHWGEMVARPLEK